MAKIYALGMQYAGEMGLPASYNDVYADNVQIGTYTDWTSIATISGQAIYGVRSNGTLWSAGRDEGGTLGRTPGFDPNYGDVAYEMGQVGTDTDWVKVLTTSTQAPAYTSAAVFALKQNGDLFRINTPPVLVATGMQNLVRITSYVSDFAFQQETITTQYINGEYVHKVVAPANGPLISGVETFGFGGFTLGQVFSTPTVFTPTIGEPIKQFANIQGSAGWWALSTTGNIYVDTNYGPDGTTTHHLLRASGATKIVSAVDYGVFFLKADGSLWNIEYNPTVPSTETLISSQVYTDGHAVSYGSGIVWNSGQSSYYDLDVGDTYATDYPVDAAVDAMYSSTGSDRGVVYMASDVVPLVANFTASPTSGNAPLSVTFTDTSTGVPTSWEWDFTNDGSVDSTSQNPTVTYSTPGTYSVKLAVTNSTSNDNEVKTGYITVSTPPPVANFTVTPTYGVAPLSVAFTNTSTGQITSYAWDFNNNGTTDSTAQSPAHVYSQPGTYSPNLVVTGPGGTSFKTATTPVTVVAAPTQPTFTPSTTSGTYPLTVTFTGSTYNGIATGWAWDFNNNGVVDATTRIASFTYTQPGTYTVRLVTTIGTPGSPGSTGTVEEIWSGLISIASPDVYYVSGTVREDTVAVQGWTVNVLNRNTGSVVAIGTTQSNGSYTIQLPTGTYNANLLVYVVDPSSPFKKPKVVDKVTPFYGPLP